MLSTQSELATKFVEIETRHLGTSGWPRQLLPRRSAPAPRGHGLRPLVEKPHYDASGYGECITGNAKSWSTGLKRTLSHRVFCSQAASHQGDDIGEV